MSDSHGRISYNISDLIILIFIMIIAAFAILTGCKSKSPSQPPDVSIIWTKYEHNPVVHSTNPVTEFFAIGQPTCLKENDTLKMWYNAGGLPHVTSRILYAWSLDGVDWTKYGAGAAVMEAGTAGSWDITIDTPEIVRDSSGYKLYYFGDTLAGGSNLKPSGRASIGVATSPDGIHWTKYSNNPILTRGNDADWDCSWIESPAVLWDSAAGVYMMWYSGVDTSSWRICIGLATSPDGFIWTKYIGNPVLGPGPAGSYDDMWVAVPAVIKTDGQYQMWYSGFSSTTGYSNLTMNYATSSDGIHWAKFSGNPLFDTHSSPYNTVIDSNGPWAPDVVYDGVQFQMWYETVAGFCLATSSGQVVTR